MKLKKRTNKEKCNAKIVDFTNPILDKQHQFPACMFDIKTNECLESLKRRFKIGYNPKKIIGFQIPYYKLRKYIPQLLEHTPNKMLLISDLHSEAWFYGSLKKEKLDFHYSYKLIPENIRQEIKAIHKEKSPGKKIELHKNLWKNVIGDDKIAMNIVRAYIRGQMSYGLDFVAVPSPMLFDAEDLDVVEKLYRTSLKLYHSDLLDIEKEQGRALSLYVNLHKDFLKNMDNIKELILMVQRLEPKAIMLKISDIGDIRKYPDLIDHWKLLMSQIGGLSDELEFPSFYLSISTEGLISHSHGIDCFTQIFNSSDNVDKAFYADSTTMKRLWTQNPRLLSGKIALYKEKDFVTRPKFEKQINKLKTLPYPMKEVSSMNYRRVLSMNDSTFRDFSKFVLMSLRDFEIQETTNSIIEGDIINIKSKFKEWLKELNLFPY